MAHQHRVVDGLTLTRENFSTPPLEMGIVPFWFWNGDLEHEELEWQLRQYYDRGVRSLFIHPRMGLNVDYLSAAWFERVRFAVAKGKEIGLDLWIYDELDWPSGTAGKQVMKADPELAQRYLELVPLHFDGPLFTFLEAHDDRYVNTGNAHPIAAYGVRQEEWHSRIQEVVDLNKNLAWEKTIPWEAPAGKWTLLYFLEKRAPYYIDTLNPASTEKFIELTHERYRRAVGDSFGGTVPGFFTDEPAMYYYHVGLDNYVVPWSRQMFKIFRDRRGYDLKPWLPALYADMGRETVRVRYDFWRTLTEQYAETYYKRIRDWCEDNGVLFTGHLLFEEHLRLAARCEGNIFKYLEHLHLTGVDHLYPKIGTEADPAQHVALKLGSSAAHHFGSARLLCESMGGTYWDCSLERMKWMNNWEYVLGVNLFNNHGYHYTIEGDRKRDWPPSQFYHHTWWRYYDRFTTYNARLSHALSGGRHVAKVLMLYPIRSIWTNYVPQRRTAVGEVIERDFEYLTDTLLRLHYDFDYVEEDVLAQAFVVDGRISIGEETFDIFVLPPVTHVKASTLLQLETFVRGGGTLIATTLVPFGLLEAADGTAVQDLETFFSIDGRRTTEAFETGDVAWDVVEQTFGGKVVFLRGPGLHRVRPKEELRRLLESAAAPDVTVSDEAVFCLHRVKDGFSLYYLVNTLQEDRGRVTVTFEEVRRPELWDPNTGEIEPIEGYDVVDGRLSVALEFPSSEARLVVLREPVGDRSIASTTLEGARLADGRVIGYSNETGRIETRVRTAAGYVTGTVQGRPARPPLHFPDRMIFESEQDNALVIGAWKMAIEEDDVLLRHASPGGEESAWIDVTQGAWEMQLPAERDEQTYPVTLWYRTHFEIVDMPQRLRLMVDGLAGSDRRLFINGEELETHGMRSSLDAEIREVDIRPFVATGRNSVVVRLEVRRRTDGVLDLLKIVGDFALGRSETGEYVIVQRRTRLEPKTWTRQGLPFFSGTGVYRATVIVPEAYFDGGRIVLEAACGEDVLEVAVNDGAVHVAPWHPYRLDVTEALHPGPNDFKIKVTNTLINLLEGVEKPSGLLAAPRLVHVHRHEIPFA